jgi:hypothetical protein
MLQKIEHLWKCITQRHKSIHLTLEVETFLDNSTPAMGSSIEFRTQSLYFPLMVVNGITGGEGKKKPIHNS